MAKAPNWFLPGWVHRRRKKKLLKTLRARDGDDCWRCHKPMRFEGRPNCGTAATLEHLLPRSKGGGDDLANLRLCHPGCNRHLADHEPAQKERMRINRKAECAGG